MNNIHKQCSYPLILAEIQLDGSIHFIGTQVGRVLSCGRFFSFIMPTHNDWAFRWKRNLSSEYYFPYADSYIIYEVMREDGCFTVFSYKTMNRICYRFIASPYRPDLFIDEEGVPYSSDSVRFCIWTRMESSIARRYQYEEYRNILYGNTDNKVDYSCFSLMESVSYQNIVRTIQNVLLNSRLEADYIKQTIITSLNEEDSVIDLTRYRSHLSGFESQLSDIGTFRDPGMMRKANGIVSLFDDIRKRNLRINDLCRQLRSAYLQTESVLPELARKIHEKEEIKSDFYKKRERLDTESKKRTAAMEAELAVLKDSLSKAEAKQRYYSGKDIRSAMDRCSKFEVLQQEQESLVTEQDLLSSKNKEASVLHAGLIANLKNELAGFENEKQKQLLAIEAGINCRRDERRDYYRSLTDDLRQKASVEKERLFADREKYKSEIAAKKMQINAVRGQKGSSEELDAVKERLGSYLSNRKDLELKMRELKYELTCQSNELETSEKRLEEDFQKLRETNEGEIGMLDAKITELTEFLDNQKDSFFSWLSENKPGWEQTIGQVCDERLLYSKEFAAEVADGDTFYGIRFTAGSHRQVKTKEDYLSERKDAMDKCASIRQFMADAGLDLEKAKERLRKQYQSSVKPIKDDLYQVDYELEQLEIRKKEDESRLAALQDQAVRSQNESVRRLEEDLHALEAALSSVCGTMDALQAKLDKEMSALQKQEEGELKVLDKELSRERESIQEEIRLKRANLEERKAEYDRRQLENLQASGGDPKRLEEINARLVYINKEIAYINETKPLVIEYLKDKREVLDKVPHWTAESTRLQMIVGQERDELKKRLSEVNHDIGKVDAELKGLKEANRKAMENREEYHRSTLSDWFVSRDSIFSSMDRGETDGDCRALVREITISVNEQAQRLSSLRKDIVAYTGNFSEGNVFAFKTVFSDDHEYMDFAGDLKDFIAEDKISEYQSRINTRNSDIFRQITADTKSMVSQEGNIRAVVEMINTDFKEKNFVGIFQCIEMRIDPSQNKIVNLLKEIRRFNEEFGWDLGQNLFSTAGDDSATREKATTLLRELIKAMDAHSGNLIRLADFFDLKFRVIENRNDTGFVERLTNVGSEGTDILVKSMVNIMLLNVFKRNASTEFSEFKLHCMMDEIGKLHPNNMAGILKFANDRDILLINGSPTEQDALSYKHIYKLEKDNDSYRIRQVITQFD